MKGIVKVYPDGTVALRGVDFEVCKGEIHGLLGENGAGKTTLVKILAGLLRPTRGEVYVWGRRVSFKSPADALRHGIGIVTQSLSLVHAFTAYENIVLGLKPTPSKQDIEKLMEEVGLKVPLDAVVESLSFGLRQKVEILKMLARRVDILILDEPTTNLSPTEVRDLFKSLRKLKEQGKTIILISHKIREVLEVADRVTVLRRGRVMGVAKASEVGPRDLARMMVGREVELVVEKPPQKLGGVALSVRNLEVLSDWGVPAVRGVSFSVYYGEIFGVAGVEGNGQLELAEALAGLRPAPRGEITLDGTDITRLGVAERYRLGLAYIPDDRAVALALDLPLAENSVLTEISYSKEYVSLMGLVRSWKLVEKVTRIIREYNVVAPSIYASAKTLSGGNQQKFIVGRELLRNPKVIIAFQPTKGLDIASTEFVRSLLAKLRSEGKAVILISSDLDEILSLSDRFAVMYNGTFMGVVRPGEVTEEEIGLMMGGYTLEEIRAGKV
jgi:simple sugar transport system ATP-binding protein